MKPLLSIIAWTLALNFLLAVGGILWLYQTGRLNDQRMQQIKEIVFAPASQPATQPAETRDPATQPSLKLEQLLAKVSSRPASEQVEFMQRTFDAQSAMLDARLTELENQRATLKVAQDQLTRDREALAAREKALLDREQEQARLASDQGFQETLELYTSMPAKQVKTIFISLDNPTIVRYLKAMEPRTAGKILKEFRTPEETTRATAILEAMRQSDLPSSEPQAE